MDKILLFIPMYNCEKQITRVLGQLSDHVCSYLSEVIIVNNRSTDNGEAAVQEYLSSHYLPIRVKLFRNAENYGLGGSHKVAFQYAIENNFDYIIVLHGDDQGNIADLIATIGKMDYHKYDSLLGARFMKDSKLLNYSHFRIWGNSIFNLFFSVISGHRIYDLGSGLNMYKVNYLKQRFYWDFPDTLSFNVFLLLYGVYSKSSFVFFPLSWREEDQTSNAKFIKQSKELLRLGILYLFAPKGLFKIPELIHTQNYQYELVYRKE